MVNSVWRSVLYTTEGMIGFIMNSFVVLVMLRNKSLLKMDSSKFLLNQSCIDAAASLLILVSHFNLGNNYGVVVHFEGDNWYDELLCRIWVGDLIMWGSFFSSTVNLTILTIERYLKIVHPMSYMSKLQSWMTKVTLVLPWLVGPLYYIILYTISAQVIDGVCKVSYWPSAVMARTTGLVTFFVQFFIPMGIMIYCYSRILMTIRNRSKNLQKYESPNTTTSSSKQVTTKTSVNDSADSQSEYSATPSDEGSSTMDSDENKCDKIIMATTVKKETESETKNKINNKIEKNIIKTLIFVCFGFFLCWVWNHVLFFLLNLGLLTNIFKYGSVFYQFSIIAAYFNCCLNPFIYIFQFEKFRNSAKNMLKCC